MSLDYFQLKDDEAIANSNIKREFVEIYHQQGAKLDNTDQNFEFFFAENINYHQIGNAYLQYEKTVEKDEAIQADYILIDGDTIKLANIAFPFRFNANKKRNEQQRVAQILTIKICRSNSNHYESFSK